MGGRRVWSSRPLSRLTLAVGVGPVLGVLRTSTHRLECRPKCCEGEEDRAYERRWEHYIDRLIAEDLRRLSLLIDGLGW